MLNRVWVKSALSARMCVAIAPPRSPVALGVVNVHDHETEALGHARGEDQARRGHWIGEREVQRKVVRAGIARVRAGTLLLGLAGRIAAVAVPRLPVPFVC